MAVEVISSAVMAKVFTLMSINVDRMADCM